METLGVDAGAETDFDSWTEGLDVRYCGDTRVVDFSLTRQRIVQVNRIAEIREGLSSTRNVEYKEKSDSVRNTVEGRRDHGLRRV